ncbi:phage replisome organizer N-terminal domain-containing protein [Solibacillus sp. FSL K6-1523]|uniref:phage replisome organizer N-terminal domain-containing protein n=1 Tax=Solibacillus sp. FSL K6-1523 TaxID=2921471 RepID=UPI0030FB38EA
MAEITWIKLKTDMFDSTKIRLIEKLPEGDTILVIWIKLLTAAGKANSNGYIMLTENIPMNVEEMSVVFDRPLNTVRLALEAFKRYGMVDVEDGELVRIANWEKHQNIDGMEKIREQNRLRKQKERERKKALAAPKNDIVEPCHVTVTTNHATEVEEDIEVDKELKRSTAAITKASPPVNIITFFQENIRFNLSPFETETIIHWENEYPYELIIEAMKRTAMANVTTLRYTEGILIDWQKKRLTTLAEIQRDDEAFNQKKGGKRYETNTRGVQTNSGNRGSEHDDFSL